MKANDYQREAQRTATQIKDIYTALNIGAMGLSGEAGEVTDAIKKVLFHEHPLDKERLIKELGDVLWYIALIATALDTDLETIMELNILKLQKRYPAGFETDKSINRKEGDV